MAAIRVVLAITLLALGAEAAVQNNCDGFPPGAKYRYQWFYQLTNTSDTKIMDSLVMKWMQNDCRECIPKTVSSGK